MIAGDVGAADHKAFLASLDGAERVRLTALSDRAGLIHLAGHLGLIAALGGLIGLGVPGWWALLPVQGVAIVFLFTLEHECTHRTPFASPWISDAVGTVCGFVLLLPFEWFRYFHLAHHRWTNLPGQDPELDSEKPGTWRAFALHVSGLPYWWGMLRQTFALARGRGGARYLPAPALPRIRGQARWMLLGYALVALSLAFDPFLFWVWLLPVLLGQPFLRVYLLAEHGDCPRVADMFQNSRTTFTTALVRFLAWNMPYHTEHHVLPAVPFHHLPALHRLMADRLRVTSDGYAAFTRAYLARRR